MRIIILFSLLIFYSAAMTSYTITSPDGNLKFMITTQDTSNKIDIINFIKYNITYDSKIIIGNSAMRFQLQNLPEIGNQLTVEDWEKREINERIELFYGKSKYLHNFCNELKLLLREAKPPYRKFTLIVRAYNEGIAFRWRFEKVSELEKIFLRDEQTQFNFPAGIAYALHLKNFRTPYENNYKILPTIKLPYDQLMGCPLLIHLNSGPWVVVTEANLHNYPGMYLLPNPDEQTGLISKLAPLLGDSTLSAIIYPPFDLPWRVIMVTDHPGKLIESNIISNLAQHCKLEDLSWIRPGKTAWDWWSDRVVEGRNFRGGMNTPTMKYYIDFAADAGLEYMLVDAGWYGKHDTLEEDISTTIAEIDMPEILRYGANKNVGIWLWVNWECVRDQMDKAFPLYEKWGVKGIKVDYMNGDSQEIVNFYWEVCKKAAEYHLMVNLHGAYKPTGLRHTYPNLLTREGVLGLEWSKWSKQCNPDHELTIPYTRMLAGPMDFTPGAFQVATQDNFKAQITRPMAMGTIAHQLAMYVVYESPLQMLVDHPASYFGKPGLNFLKDVPTVWDETKFIMGEIGDYIVLVRRQGDDWYLGAMTDWDSRQIDIPLDFLGSRIY
ncbi:MAG: glycoside hydrolase family 97 protein, partial [Calditrichia bacterium]|nr:glycoside hydrolase family 97 protein [Calditrichia bacterium]